MAIAGQCSKFDTVTVITSTHTHTTPHHSLAAIWAEETSHSDKKHNGNERYTIGKVMGDETRHCALLRAAHGINNT